MADWLLGLGLTVIAWVIFGPITAFKFVGVFIGVKIILHGYTEYKREEVKPHVKKSKPSEHNR